MNRNRYLLCLLVCGMMLYYALPNLELFEEGERGLFSISWLILFLFVFAGNLSALLYTPRQAKRKKDQISSKHKKKVRLYN